MDKIDQESQLIQAWHALDLQSLEQALDARPGGLTGSEAAERLEKFGPNVLPHAPHPAWWQIALRQFRSPLENISTSSEFIESSCF